MSTSWLPRMLPLPKEIPLRTRLLRILLFRVRVREKISGSGSISVSTQNVTKFTWSRIARKRHRTSKKNFSRSIVKESVERARKMPLSQSHMIQSYVNPMQSLVVIQSTSRTRLSPWCSAIMGPMSASYRPPHSPKFRLSRATLKLPNSILRPNSSVLSSHMTMEAH